MSNLPKKYEEIVKSLKEKIRLSRINAVYTVNAQLLAIYWEIGKTILEQQSVEGWGTKVIDRLSRDLKAEFPEMKGLSVRNIKYMRAFAEAYPNFNLQIGNHLIQSNIQPNEIVQVALAQIDEKQKDKIVQVNLAQLSWYHHITLLDKVKDPEIRLFYIQQTIENGWSRDVMVHQIEGELHKRQGNIINNFQSTIPSANSELALQVFKDPYKFDFIYLGKEAKERDLEDALINQMTKFLLELGQWFSFMGRQYKITLGDKEYFFDLLFYHTRLKRYIVIDLKIDEFKPEYKGKMEFYLNLADDQLKGENDNPSIGLILCKTKDGLVAEYALRDSNKPIGIAEYQLNKMLPEEIKGELPSVEELEKELEREVKNYQKPIEVKLSKLKELLSNLKSDEVKEKKTPENTTTIFMELLFPLKNKIIQELKKEITPLFESIECFIWLDSRGLQNDEEIKKYFIENLKKQCYKFKIEIRSNGFKKVGTKAFDIIKSLIIRLENYSYICEFEGLAGIFLEKLYHQLPNNKEIEKIAERFCEWLIDDINQHLERLS